MSDQAYTDRVMIAGKIPFNGDGDFHEYLVAKCESMGLSTDTTNVSNPNLALAARIELFEMKRDRALRQLIKNAETLLECVQKEVLNK